MTWLLLGLGVAGTIVPPWRGQRWVAPLAALAIGWAVGVVDGTGDATRPLLAPVALLLLAVPLAILLERLAFFSALAGRLRGGPGRLWMLGALVTTVLNLDTSVVLLTPLYARINRRLALQPVLLALVASSALPVSNLTNLIAASGAHVSTAAVLGHLGLPSLVATAVGWSRYRRLAPGPVTSCPSTELGDVPSVDPVATAVVAAVVVGFVGGREVGIEPWVVGLVAVAVLGIRARHLPWRSVPIGAGVAVLALGALAAAATRDLDLHRLATADGPTGVVVVAVIAAVAANLVNNLPVVLVGADAAGSGPGLWPLLLGVNMGPFLLVTGSLASLLWLESTQSLGLGTSARDFTSAAVRVVGPAFAAAVATMAIMSLLPAWS